MHLAGHQAQYQFGNRAGDHLPVRPLRENRAERPDLTPYAALVPTQPPDQVNPPLARAALESRRFDLSRADAIDHEAFSRVIWQGVKGEHVPYPGARRMSAPEAVRGGSTATQRRGTPSGPPRGADCGGRQRSQLHRWMAVSSRLNRFVCMAPASDENSKTCEAGSGNPDPCAPATPSVGTTRSFFSSLNT